MTRSPALRASDLDREWVADYLRQATTDGRLDAGELERRLHVAFSARTYRQLQAVLADLPALEMAGRGMPIWARATLGLSGAVGVLAAAATATLLFAGIATASGAWALLGRLLLGRGRRPAPARAPALTLARRHPATKLAGRRPAPALVRASLRR